MKKTEISPVTSVRWAVMFRANSKQQAETIQSVLGANHILAFVEGQLGGQIDPVLKHRVDMFPIHVPLEQVSAAKETLRRFGQFI